MDTKEQLNAGKCNLHTIWHINKANVATFKHCFREHKSHYSKSIGGAYENPANASSASWTLADNAKVECEHPSDDVTGSLVNCGSMCCRSITPFCKEKAGSFPGKYIKADIQRACRNTINTSN